MADTEVKQASKQAERKIQMTKSRKDALIAELLNEGMASDEGELLSMLEDMGTTLEDVESGDWY